jgi:hypothetical protein
MTETVAAVQRIKIIYIKNNFYITHPYNDEFQCSR